MSLRQTDVEDVREKCHELLRRIEALPPIRKIKVLDERGIKYVHRYESGRECAAVKRQSLELSHALAKMRKPWREDA